MIHTPLLHSLLYPTALICAVAVGSAYAADVLRAENYGVSPKAADNSAAMQKLLKAAATRKTGCNIILNPGKYHFYSQSALPMHLYISNHDQQPEHRVGIPLVGLNDIKIKGKGARFIFHGNMLPFVLMDCKNISISDLSIEYAEPYSCEACIIDIKKKYTTVKLPAWAQYSVENDLFYNTSNGRKERVNCALVFRTDGLLDPSGQGGDIVWPYKAKALSANHVRFDMDAASMGLQEGHWLVLRGGSRPNPAMLLYRAKDTELKDVVFHDSQGMALVAQRSENITIRGGGCVRAKDRAHSVSADATHFSNCRGHISVRHAIYEAMMDDAINVHATCLGIQEIIDSRTFIARYMHHQAIGFEIMAPGEQLQFIHGPTLELNPQLAKVQKVEMIDPCHVRVTLENDIPAGIGIGDAVENADWHPSVDFSYNTIRHNRARGALFTTPKEVRVIGNHFDHTHGSAILLAGDAQGWYESGACRDVLIKHNTFRHALTGIYQFTDAVIAICPEVSKPELQKERYHRNVSIVNNYFITHRVPLLSATSAKNVRFMHNSIQYHDIYPSVDDGVPYILKDGCEEMQLQKPH